MGTITARKRSDGSVSFQAQISLKRDGEVHRESKSFERRQAAYAWLERRERELSKPGAIVEEKAKAADVTLAEAIDRYVAESVRTIGRTKAQVLRTIKTFEIAEKLCGQITSADVVAFARQKLATGVTPQTVGTYLSHLSTIFDIARPAWKINLDPQAFSDAVKVATRMGITGKSERRERRPTLDEIDRLMVHFEERSRRRATAVPMQRIIAFAVFSTRRQEEILRIRWADLDEEGSRVLVRDLKHPNEKKGNHVWCDLPAEALRIVNAMPKMADEIFPYSTDAVSAAFTRAVQFLEIDDLHFHDLRHDGISCLFEQGWTIPKVASVSGHRTWGSLSRYTHLRHTGNRYAGWKWLEKVSSPDPDLRLTARGALPRSKRAIRASKPLEA